MDKYFLLTYTMNGKDGFRHSYHAWFETEKELRAFAAEKEGLEVDLAIQIVLYPAGRSIFLTRRHNRRLRPDYR